MNVWKQAQSSKSNGGAPGGVGTTTSSNFTFTNGPQAKGKTNEQMIFSGSGNPVALEKSTQQNEVVDVMHAGIDT